MFIIWTTFSFLCITIYASPLNESLEDPKPKLSYSINPGCNVCSGDKITLLYIKVEDETKHMLHQLWDFTSDHPTVLYLITDKNATIDLNWKGEVPVEINPSSPILYSYAILLYNLIEYIDANNTVFFDYNQTYRDISLRFTKWTWRDIVLTEENVQFEMQGILNAEHSRISGTIKIKLRLRSKDGRADSFPRLPYTTRAVQVDISLQNLTSWYRDERARFAVRFVVVSEGDRSKALDYTVVYTNDDEYTPGVFKLNYLLTPSSQTKKGGYIVFRPVAFRDEERTIAASVPSSVWSYNRTTLPWECLAGRFYQHRYWAQLLEQEAIFSFGDRGDGYYRQTNYTSWSLSMEYGDTMREAYSYRMLALMLLALALPLAAALVVCVYIINTYITHLRK